MGRGGSSRSGAPFDRQATAARLTQYYRGFIGAQVRPGFDQWSGDHPGLALVRAWVGETAFVARVTRRAICDLSLVIGQEVWLQVKSVALMGGSVFRRKRFHEHDHRGSAVVGATPVLTVLFSLTMCHRTVGLRSSSRYIPGIFTMPFPQSLPTAPFERSSCVV